MQTDSNTAGGGDVEERCLVRLVELATRLRAALNGSSERALQLHSALSGLLDDCAVLRRARKHGRVLSCTPRLIVAGRAEEEGKHVMDFLSANHALQVGAIVAPPSRSTTPPTTHDPNNANGLPTMFDLSIAQGSLPSPGRSFNTLVSFNYSDNESDSASCSTTTSSDESHPTTSSVTRDAQGPATLQSQPTSVPPSEGLAHSSDNRTAPPPPSLSVSCSSREPVTPSSTAVAASLTIASSSSSMHTSSTTTVPELDTPNPLPLTTMPSPVELYTLQLDDQAQGGGTVPRVTNTASGAVAPMSGMRPPSSTPLSPQCSPPTRSPRGNSRSGSLHRTHHSHSHHNSVSGGGGPSPTSSRSGQTFITFVLHNDESAATLSGQPSPNTLVEPSTPILSRRPHHSGPLSSGSGDDEHNAENESVDTHHELHETGSITIATITDTEPCPDLATTAKMMAPTDTTTHTTKSPRHIHDNAKDEASAERGTRLAPCEAHTNGDKAKVDGNSAHVNSTTPSESQPSKEGVQDTTTHTSSTTTGMNTTRERRSVTAASLPCLPTALVAQRHTTTTMTGAASGHSPLDCAIGHSIVTLPFLTTAGMASSAIQPTVDMHNNNDNNNIGVPTTTTTTGSTTTTGMDEGGAGRVLHGPRPPVTAAIAPNDRRPVRRKQLAAMLPRYMPRLNTRPSSPSAQVSVPLSSHNKMHDNLMMPPVAPTRSDGTGTQPNACTTSAALSGPLPPSHSPSTPSLPPLPSSRAATPMSLEAHQTATASAVNRNKTKKGDDRSEASGRGQLTPLDTARALSLSSTGQRVSEERPPLSPSTPAHATGEEKAAVTTLPAMHEHDMHNVGEKDAMAVCSIVTSPTKHGRREHHALLSASSLRRQSRPSPYTSFTVLNQRVHKTFSGGSLSAHMLRSPWEMPQYSNTNDGNMSSGNAYYVPVPRMIEATVLELLQRTHTHHHTVHSTSASQMSLTLMRNTTHASSRSLRQPFMDESESAVMMPPSSSSRRLLLPMAIAQGTGSFCTHSMLSEARLARRERRVETAAAFSHAELTQSSNTSNGSSGHASRQKGHQGKAETSESGTNTTTASSPGSKDGAEQVERPHTSPFITPLDQPGSGLPVAHNGCTNGEGDQKNEVDGSRRQPSPLQLRGTHLTSPSCLTRHESGNSGRRQGSASECLPQSDFTTPSGSVAQGRHSSRPHAMASWTIQYVGDCVLRCAPLKETRTPRDDCPRARSANAILNMLHNTNNNNSFSGGHRCRDTPLTPSAPATVLGDAFLYCIDCAEVMSERGGSSALRRSLRALFHPFGGAELERCAATKYNDDDNAVDGSGVAKTTMCGTGAHAMRSATAASASFAPDTTLYDGGNSSKVMEDNDENAGQLTCAQRRMLSQAIAQQTWFVLTRAERIYGVDTSAAVQRYAARSPSSTRHGKKANTPLATAAAKGTHAGQSTKTTALTGMQSDAAVVPCDAMGLVVQRFIAAVRRWCGVEVAEWQVLPLSCRHSLAARDFLTVHYYYDLLKAGVLGESAEGHTDDVRDGGANSTGCTNGALNAQPLATALHGTAPTATTPSSGSTASTALQNTFIPSPPSLSTRHAERLLSRQGSNSVAASTNNNNNNAAPGAVVAGHGRHRPLPESSSAAGVIHACETMQVVPSPPATPPPSSRPVTMATTTAAAVAQQMPSSSSAGAATLPPSPSATLTGRTAYTHITGSPLAAKRFSGNGEAILSSGTADITTTNNSHENHTLAVVSVEEVLSCEAERYAKAVLRSPHDVDALRSAVARDSGPVQRRETSATATFVQLLYRHAVQDMWYRSGAEGLARVARLLDRHAFTYLLSRAALSLLTWSAQLLARLPYMRAIAQERLRRMEQRYDGIEQALRCVAESRAKQRACTPHSRLCALHNRLQSAFEHVTCHFLTELRGLLIQAPSTGPKHSLSSSASSTVPSPRLPSQPPFMSSANASQTRLGVPALPAAYERLRQKVAAFVAFYRDAAWERRIAALRDELQSLRDTALSSSSPSSAVKTETNKSDDDNVAAQRRRIRQETARIAEERHRLERGLLQHLSQLNTEIINCFVAVCCYDVLPKFTAIVEDELRRISDENTAILQIVAESAGDVTRRAPFVPLWRNRRVTASQLGLISLPAHQTLGHFVTALRAALCEDQIRALARYHDRSQRLTKATQETPVPPPSSRVTSEGRQARPAETNERTNSEVCVEGADVTASPVSKEGLPSPPPLIQTARSPSGTALTFMSGLLPEPTNTTTLLWQELEETTLTARTAALVREWLARHGVVAANRSQHTHPYYSYGMSNGSTTTFMTAGGAASSTSTVITLAPTTSGHRIAHAPPPRARSTTPSVGTSASRPVSRTRRHCGGTLSGRGGARSSSSSGTRSAVGKPHSVVAASRVYRGTNMADYVATTTNGGGGGGPAPRPQTNASLISVPLIDFAAPPAANGASTSPAPPFAAYSTSGRNEDAEEEEDGGVNSFSRNVPLFFWASTSVLTSRTSTNRNDSDSCNVANGVAGSTRCSVAEATNGTTQNTAPPPSCAVAAANEAATATKKKKESPSATAHETPTQLTRKETAPYRGSGCTEPGTMATVMTLMNTATMATGTANGMAAGDEVTIATTPIATNVSPCHSPPDSSSSGTNEGGVSGDKAGVAPNGAAALYATESTSSSSSSSFADFQPLQVWCQRLQSNSQGGLDGHSGTAEAEMSAMTASPIASAAEHPMIWLLLQTWERSLLAMSYDAWMEVRCEHYAEVLNQYAVEVLSAQQEWQSEFDRARTRLAEQMRLVHEELANMTTPTEQTSMVDDSKVSGECASQSPKPRSLEQEARQTLDDTHALLQEVSTHRARELAVKLEQMQTEACRFH